MRRNVFGISALVLLAIATHLSVKSLLASLKEPVVVTTTAEPESLAPIPICESEPHVMLAKIGGRVGGDHWVACNRGVVKGVGNLCKVSFLFYVSIYDPATNAYNIIDSWCSDSTTQCGGISTVTGSYHNGPTTPGDYLLEVDVYDGACDDPKTKWLNGDYLTFVVY